MKKINIVVVCVLLLKVTLSFCQDNKQEGRFNKKISEYEAWDKLNKHGDSLVLFVGSSSIRKWENLADYFPEHNVLNRGFGGSEFSDLLHYVNRIVLPYKPMKIFVYEGDNDLGRNKKPREVYKQAKEFREIISKELPNTSVVFISPKPSISRWHLKKNYQKLNKLLKRYSRKTDKTEFANVWDPLIENGKVMDDIFLEDNLHLNSKGYDIWVEVLTPFIDVTE